MTFAPIISVATALAAVISAQAASVTAIAWSGQSASTGPSGDVRFSGFSNVAVNNAGTVAFKASVRELVTPPWVIALTAGRTVTNVPVDAVYPIPAPGPAPSPTPRPLITNSWSGIWTFGEGVGRSQIVRTSYDGYPFLMDAPEFGTLGAPLLNNSNLCAYSGNYSPGYIYRQPTLPGVPVTNFLSVYGGPGVWTSRSTPDTPVVFLGQTAPGYSIPFTTSVGTQEREIGNGRTNAVPDPTLPITFTNFPGFSSIDGMAISDTGHLVLSATATTSNDGTPPVSSNGPGGLDFISQTLLHRGIWGQDAEGCLVPIIREGEPFSFGGSNRIVAALAPESLLLRGTNGMTFSTGSVNRSGEVAVSVAFTDGSQAVVVASARTNSVAIASISGDPAPGGLNGDLFLGFSCPSINSAGHVAFLGTAGFVTQSPIVYSPPLPGTIASSSPAPQPAYTNSWSGLWAEDASGNVRLITRIAPPVPDIGGFTALGNPLINSRHQVAFQGTYRQGYILRPQGTFRGGQGVWRSVNLTNPVAWVGQKAPGYPVNFSVSVRSPYGWTTNMITFRSAAPVLSSIDRIAFPDNGRLVVWATASATNWVPRPPVPPGTVVTQEIRSSVLTQRGIWIQNARGTLELALREGMSVAVNGTRKTISSLPPPASPYPSQGQETLCGGSNVVTTAVFTDGTQAVLRIMP